MTVENKGIAKTKPIILREEIIKSSLEGNETHVHRIPFIHPSKSSLKGLFWDEKREKLNAVFHHNDGTDTMIKSKYLQGDILYVKETWGCYCRNWWEADYFVYKADFDPMVAGIHTDTPQWRSPAVMPREAARLFYRVTDIRVERLQAVTEEQAVKEGFLSGRQSFGDGKFEDVLESEWTAVKAFCDFWDTTIVKQENIQRYGSEANPYVWVYSLERCERVASNE